jgi:site-specific recombinase XerD
MDIYDVTYLDALNWMNMMHDKYKNKTINEYLSVIKSVFDIALKNKIIESNIFESFGTLTGQDREYFLND